MARETELHPAFPMDLTFVLSWIVDVEVAIPHNRQFHRQIVDLHPLIGVLWGDQRKEVHSVLEKDFVTGSGPGQATQIYIMQGGFPWGK